MQHGTVIHGGATDEADLYMAPTLIENVPLDSPLMNEEIFGPLLPIIGYRSLREAIGFVNARPRPLSAYFFSRSTPKQELVLDQIPFGGGCINDTLTHYVPPSLPFGGVGASGMGNYRGKAGFDAFSHRKSIIRRSPLALDWLIRLTPYRRWQLAMAKIFLR